MMLPFSTSLSIRVPLIAASLMVLVGVVASRQVLETLTEVQDERVREIAELHFKALSVALGPFVLREDIWEVYDTLDRATQGAEGNRLIFTVVSDETGQVLAATDPRRAPLDSPVAAFFVNAKTLDDLSVAGQASQILLRAPLIFQGRRVGEIVSELNISDLVQERRRATRLLLLGNALATGILAILGYLATRRMLSPITRLAKHMEETTGSPEATPISYVPRGDTELTRLFETYNNMTTAIEHKAEAERRLAERERFVSLGRLSSSLAHEINNPLGGLLNAADTIKEYAERPDVVRSSADLLTRGLRHMKDVTRAILDENRMDRSATPLTAEDLDDVKLLIYPEIRWRVQRLSWTVRLSPGKEREVPAAPTRQILLNLLLNASTAAGEGGEIGLSFSEAEDGTVSLIVSDNGPGISESARRRLLSSEPVAPGGGVGLRLVRDLVKGLSGSIFVDREDGETRIRVDLPAATYGRRCEPC
ncbi:sensor histidine kinase [Aliiruegeria lutimaris]|uniref:histidine kinase n=1 Tax=Aliiruegeria lutimaris TaxID=571298 RepID=A0A1G8Q0D8_9RHOB|nr:HAMP domain-containing sensor histidine kinase [Aliiruegeria lutimaris]SDI98157.1 Signal transduction histidine kinase [Aliiruegeria lutimaris]